MHTTADALVNHRRAVAPEAGVRQLELELIPLQFRLSAARAADRRNASLMPENRRWPGLNVGHVDSAIRPAEALQAALRRWLVRLVSTSSGTRAPATIAANTMKGARSVSPNARSGIIGVSQSCQLTAVSVQPGLECNRLCIVIDLRAISYRAISYQPECFD